MVKSRFHHKVAGVLVEINNLNLKTAIIEKIRSNGSKVYKINTNSLCIRPYYCTPLRSYPTRVEIVCQAARSSSCRISSKARHIYKFLFSFQKHLPQVSWPYRWPNLTANYNKLNLLEDEINKREFKEIQMAARLASVSCSTQGTAISCPDSSASWGPAGLQSA